MSFTRLAGWRGERCSTVERMNENACMRSSEEGRRVEQSGVRVIALFVVVGARVHTSSPILLPAPSQVTTSKRARQCLTIKYSRFSPLYLLLVRFSSYFTSSGNLQRDTRVRNVRHNIPPLPQIRPHFYNAYRMCKGVAVMRRRSDSWLNATQILKVAGFDKPQRTRVLEREVQKGEHEKVQGGYGKYQGQFAFLLSSSLKLDPIISQGLGYLSSEDSPSRGNTIVKQPFVLLSSSSLPRKAHPSLRNTSYPPRLPLQNLLVGLQPPSSSQVLLSLPPARAVMSMLKKTRNRKYFPNPVQKMVQ